MVMSRPATRGTPALSRRWQVVPSARSRDVSYCGTRLVDPSTPAPSGLSRGLQGGATCPGTAPGVEPGSVMSCSPAITERAGAGSAHAGAPSTAGCLPVTGRPPSARGRDLLGLTVRALRCTIPLRRCLQAEDAESIPGLRADGR